MPPPERPAFFQKTMMVGLFSGRGSHGSRLDTAYQPSKNRISSEIGKGAFPRAAGKPWRMRLVFLGESHREYIAAYV